jgi:hypothetical protein
MAASSAVSTTPIGRHAAPDRHPFVTVFTMNVA